jgi:hypothetical protein
VSGRIYPTWEQIHAFKTPLTPGELSLAQYLDQNLPPGWEIFVQPFMNGDRPDLAILNPKVGMMIFEVKDWHAGLYEVKNRIDYIGGRQVTFRDFYVSDARGKQHIASPIKQIERYRENLINLYLPEVGESIDKDSRILGLFKLGLYFHYMTTKQANALVPTKDYIVLGYDGLVPDRLSSVVPDIQYAVSKYMKPDWAKGIRYWLLPPQHALEMGQTIRLTGEQRRHTEPASGQHQRLRGVAGSGKTLVIAHRAARLAEQGKRVLVVTFNITLWHYIRDFVSNSPYKFEWSLIEFNHFHGFCRNFLSENDIPWPGNGENIAELLTKVVPEVVLKTREAGINANNREYDSILIDEGQDFERLWYKTLCAFLSANDEVLFVADERQNVYGRSLSWIDAMEETRFRGRWRELKQSYRLSRELVANANQFASQFLRQEGLPMEPAPDDLFTNMKPRLFWRNIISAEDQHWQDSVIRAFNFFTIKLSLHPQDIVILIPTHKDGWVLVNQFQKKGIQVNHVFEDEQKNHHHKKSFWMGDSRLKISTIHSFKGWELRNVILVTGANERADDDSQDRIIYTAITRSRQNLVIFNRHARYAAYGETWPQNW